MRREPAAGTKKGIAPGVLACGAAAALAVVNLGSLARSAWRVRHGELDYVSRWEERLSPLRSSIPPGPEPLGFAAAPNSHGPDVVGWMARYTFAPRRLEGREDLPVVIGYFPDPEQARAYAARHQRRIVASNAECHVMVRAP